MRPIEVALTGAHVVQQAMNEKASLHKVFSVVQEFARKSRLNGPMKRGHMEQLLSAVSILPRFSIYVRVMPDTGGLSLTPEGLTRAADFARTTEGRNVQREMEQLVKGT